MKQKKIRLIHHKNFSYVSLFDPVEGSANMEAGLPYGLCFELFPLRDKVFGRDSLVSIVANRISPGANIYYVAYKGESDDDGREVMIVRNADFENPLSVTNEPNSKIFTCNIGYGKNWKQKLRPFIYSLAVGYALGSNQPRSFDCTAVDIVRPINGTSAYVESRGLKKLRLFDVHPVSVIVNATGGVATDFEGDDLSKKVIYSIGDGFNNEEINNFLSASNQHIHKNLIDAINNTVLYAFKNIIGY